MSAERSFDEAVYNLDTQVHLFYQACADLNMSFNPNISKVTQFAKGSKKVINISINISINGIRVNQSASFKFLERIINASLPLQEYYLKTFKNCQSTTIVIKFMKNFAKRTSPKESSKFDKSLVRSKIKYIYSISCSQKNHRLFSTLHWSLLLDADTYSKI